MLPGLCLIVQLRRKKTEGENFYQPVLSCHAAHLTCTSRSLYVTAAHAGALTISVWQMIDRWFYSPSERKASK